MRQLQEGVDYDGSGTSSAEDSMFPSKLVEGTPDSGHHSMALDGSQADRKYILMCILYHYDSLFFFSRQHIIFPNFSDYILNHEFQILKHFFNSPSLLSPSKADLCKVTF